MQHGKYSHNLSKNKILSTGALVRSHTLLYSSLKPVSLLCSTCDAYFPICQCLAVVSTILCNTRGSLTITGKKIYLQYTHTHINGYPLKPTYVANAHFVQHKAVCGKYRTAFLIDYRWIGSIMMDL